MVWLVSLLFATAGARPLPTIPSETTSLRGHLLPNEFENFRQFPRDQRRGGAVISVGSFRAFNLAAAVRAHYLIALDAAGSVARFDDEIAARIVADERRAGFIGAMLGAKRELQTREEAIAWLKARSQETYFSFGYAPGLFETYRREIEPETDAEDRAHYLEHVGEYFRTPERYAATFFGSDEAYRHVREMVMEGRYRAVTGRLEGPTAFSEITYALDSVQARVTTLDISNALDFIHTRLAVGQFVQNLRRLNFTREGRVLYTDHNGQWSPWPEFTYHSATPEIFARHLALATTAHAARFPEALRDARFKASSCAAGL